MHECSRYGAGILITMYLSLCFARVSSTGPFAQDVGFDIEDAYLAAIMRSASISADMFGAGASGKLADTLGRLDATLANRFFFHVDKYNLGVTRHLANSLKQRRACGIHLWSHDAALVPAEPSVIIFQNILEMAAEMAKAATGSERFAPKAASPYLDAFIFSRLKSHREFILVDTDQLKQDLAWRAALPAARKKDSAVVNALHAPMHQIKNAAALVAAWCLETGCAIELRLSTQAYAELKLSRLEAPSLSFELHGTPHSSALPANARYARHPDFNALAAAYPRNGTLVYFSGAYPDVASPPAITHLYIAADASEPTERSALAWASDNMALRSVRIHASATRASQDTLWPTHRYVLDASSPGFFTVSADAWNPNTFSLQVRPGMDASEKNADLNLTTAGSEEVNQLFDKLALFESQGTLPFEPRPAHLVNGCRWATVGRCVQDRFRRIQIDAEGAVRSCIDSPPIGNVDTPFDEIRRKVTWVATEKSIQRGCLNCPVRSDCSRCNSMPVPLENEYCSLRKSYPLLPLFLELRLLPLMWPALFAQAGALPWRISAPGLPNVFVPDNYRSQWRRSSSIILSNGPATLLWERGTKNISKTTAAMAFILEGDWCGIDPAALAVIAAPKFGISETDARKHIDDGLVMLKKGKLC